MSMTVHFGQPRILMVLEMYYVVYSVRSLLFGAEYMYRKCIMQCIQCRSVCIQVMRSEYVHNTLLNTPPKYTVLFCIAHRAVDILQIHVIIHAEYSRNTCIVRPATEYD